MSVSTVEAGVVRIGDGVTTVFSFSFEGRNAAEIKVSNIVGLELIPVTSGFTVTLNPSGEGGIVTFAAAPVALQPFYLYRETSLTQLVGVSSQQKYDPRVVEDVWDKLTFITQELAADVALAVKTTPNNSPEALLADIFDAKISASTAAGDAAGSAMAAAQSAADALAAENSLVEWKGTWVPATTYAPSDLVPDSGSTYICVVPHVSSATFATDLALGRWAVFAQKGDAGAGTGDVLAANSGSEYISTQGVFRNNISAAVRINTVQSGQDLHTDISDTATYDLGTGNTNAPAGQADGDALWSRRRDGSVQNLLALLADGSLHTKTRRGGTWGAWIRQATEAWVTGQIAASNQMLHVRDERASGTYGGNSTTTYQPRVLNLIRTNTIPGATLAANIISLPAGTYDINATAPGYGCGRHRARLWNQTSGTTLILGTVERTVATGELTVSQSRIQGRFTLAVPSQLTIQHAAGILFVNQGWGLAAGFGDNEVYTDVIIRKVS